MISPLVVLTDAHGFLPRKKVLRLSLSMVASLCVRSWALISLIAFSLRAVSSIRRIPSWIAITTWPSVSGLRIFRSSP